MFALFSAFLALLSGFPGSSVPVVSYHVAIVSPQTHLFQVEMNIDGLAQESIDLSMPVWTPGSYLIREYERQVEDFRATDAAGVSRSWKKVDKNTWRVDSAGVDSLRLTYTVYGRENSIRWSYVNSDGGHILGVNLFLYIEGKTDLPASLQLRLPEGWKVSNGLFADAADPLRYHFTSYHELVDSPMLIGTHEERSFTVNGIPHLVAMTGPTDADYDLFVGNCRKIVEAAAEMMGDLPYKKYCFIMRFGGGGGGLEHSNGTTMGTSRWGHAGEKEMNDLAGLVAHEYFHVWNVKMVRPAEFVPYVYDRESYTDALWYYEGATSYFAEKLLLRAGIINTATYFTELSKRIASYRAAPGHLLQSAVDSSFDTWIKQYREDENSPSVLMSYYTKGDLLGMALDLELLGDTNGRVGIVDVMRAMVKETLATGRGFSTADIRTVCEQLSGVSLADFFRKYVYNLEEIPFESLIERAGYHLAPNDSLTKRDNKGGYLGARVTLQNNRIVVNSVLRGTPAYTAGLDYSDEIIAIDGIRMNRVEDVTRLLTRHKPGDEITVLVAREGLMRQLSATLNEYPQPVYSILPMKQPSASQVSLRARWPSEGIQEGAAPGGAAKIAGGLPTEL